MLTIQINGQITPSGELKVVLPPGLPPGEVQITLEFKADATWTPEELEELLRPVPPLTGAEIVKAGLLGGWKDQGIADGAAWVEAQRRRQRGEA